MKMLPMLFKGLQSCFFHSWAMRIWYCSLACGLFRCQHTRHCHAAHRRLPMQAAQHAGLPEARRLPFRGTCLAWLCRMSYICTPCCASGAACQGRMLPGKLTAVSLLYHSLSSSMSGRARCSRLLGQVLQKPLPERLQATGQSVPRLTVIL